MKTCVIQNKMFAMEMFSHYPSLCSVLLAAQCIKVMTGNMAKSSQRDKVMQCQGVSGRALYQWDHIY